MFWYCDKIIYSLYKNPAVNIDIIINLKCIVNHISTP